MASAVSRCSHNAFPHIVAGVDTWNLTVTLNCFNKFVYILAVLRSLEAGPAAASGRIGLNVKPDHAIVLTSHSRNEFVDLGLGALAPAREHVDVNVGDPCSSCIGYVLRSVSVKGSIGHKCTGYGERYSTTLPALVSC